MMDFKNDFINFYNKMSRLYYETKVKVNVHLLSFENINIYAKGTYRLKIEAFINTDRCEVKSAKELARFTEIGKKDSDQYFTKDLVVKYQNEKAELNELITVETPVFKYSKDSKIVLKLTLLRGESCKCEENVTEYTPLRVSYGIIRFPLNNVCQYIQASFQQPFSSTLSAIVLVQPIRLNIQCKEGRNQELYNLGQVRKDVKKMRYDSYLLYNKFKNIFYGEQNKQIQFTLPKLFVSGDKDMEEVATDEQKFLFYLVSYEQQQLSREQMNLELSSICDKNWILSDIFNENCLRNTIYLNKMKTDFEEKQTKRFKLHIIKEEYKERFYEDYKVLLKEKLCILHKEGEIGWQDQTLNNIAFKMDNLFQEIKPTDLPIFPAIIHETNKIKSTHSIETSIGSKKHKYILILAHGYQGSPDDLTMFANGFKKKFKKTKYLILKSYRDLMCKPISTMADLAVKEVDTYLGELDLKKDKEYRIVMIGHSMGGLILRIVSNRIKEKYKDMLYGYVSLGTPHLGYLQGIKFHIRAGLSLFSSMNNNPCLNELSGKDREELRQTSICNISKEGTLEHFSKIILISCNKDKYVSWHSSRLQNFNKDLLKEITFFENEMVNNILGRQGQIRRIDRLQVDFMLTEGGMDKIIGRTCHIKLLTDMNFIEMMCGSCLPNILED